MDTFYARYAHLCTRNGYEPCSQYMADALGTTKASISIWRKRGTTPMGDTVAAAADKLNTSTDFLLGRCEDPGFVGTPTDPQPIEEVKPDADALIALSNAFVALDTADRAKVEEFIALLAMQPKYKKEDA